MEAETVVRCISGAGKFAAIDDFVVDCLDIMARLENASVCYVKRECNVVAHSLVGLSNPVGCMSRKGNVPVHIMTTLHKDFQVNQ